MGISTQFILAEPGQEAITKLDYANDLRIDGEEPVNRDKPITFSISLFEDPIDPVDMQILDVKIVKYEVLVSEGSVEYDTEIDFTPNIVFSGLPADRSSENVENLDWLTALGSYEWVNSVHANPVFINGISVGMLGINWKQDAGNGNIEYVDLDGNTASVASFDLLPEDFMSITQVKFDDSVEGRAAHPATMTIRFEVDILIRKRHYDHTDTVTVGEGEGATVELVMVYEEDPIELGVNPYWIRNYPFELLFETDITFELGANSDNAKNIEIYNKKSVSSKMMYQQNPEKLEKDMEDLPESTKQKIRTETLLTPLKPLLLAKVLKISIPSVDSPDPTKSSDGLDEARAKSAALVATKSPDGSIVKGDIGKAAEDASKAASAKADAELAKISTNAENMVGGLEAATAKALDDVEKIMKAKFGEIEAQFEKMKEQSAAAMAVIEGFMIPSPPSASVLKKEAMEQAKKAALAAAPLP